MGGVFDQEPGTLDFVGWRAGKRGVGVVSVWSGEEELARKKERNGEFSPR